MKEQINEWPKKLSAAKYNQRWHVDRSKESTINDIRADRLPGGQEPSGQWFVWVNVDLSPAFGYQGPAFSQKQGTGNSVADGILSKLRSVG